MTTLLDAPRAPHPAYLASRRELALLLVKHNLPESAIAVFAKGSDFDLTAAEAEKLRADGVTPGEAGLLHSAQKTATDGLRSTVMPRLPLPLLGEGWTGSGSCSECYANHGSGSGYCGCECHNRWSARLTVAAQDEPTLTEPTSPAKPPKFRVPPQRTAA